MGGSLLQSGVLDSDGGGVWGLGLISHSGKGTDWPLPRASKLHEDSTKEINGQKSPQNLYYRTLTQVSRVL